MTRRTVERMWSDVDGRTMHARRIGPGYGSSGRDVVLVHGLGMSSRYMLPLVRAIAERGEDYTVYAPDLPGYGRSQNPGHRLRLPELAAALNAWMDVAGIQPATVLGNSLGAQIVVQLALSHPERVSHAVLVGATRDPGSGGSVNHLLRLTLDGLRERPSLPLVAATDYFRAGPQMMLNLFREALRAPEESQLAALKVPTLIVRGGRDPISTQPWNARMADLIPGSRLVVIPGAPHAVNYSAADSLADQLLAFIAP